MPAEIGAMPAQEEAVADRVAVDRLVVTAPGLGSESAPVDGDCGRYVEAPPTAQLQPPGELRIFPVREKGLGEHLGAVVGDILERLSPQQERGGGASENPGHAVVGAVIGGAGGAVEMSSRAGDDHPRRVDHRLRLESSSFGAHQLGAESADPSRRGLARQCLEEAAHEIGPRRAVRVEEQDPRCRCFPDAAVGGGGETGVVVFANYHRRERAGMGGGDIGRAVGRGVVHDHHPHRPRLEPCDRPETGGEGVGVVMGHDDNGVWIRLDHAVILAHAGVRHQQALAGRDVQWPAVMQGPDSVLEILIPVLILLPGYSLLPRGYPQRLRLPFVIFTSVVVSSVIGLALMVVGHFNVPLLAALEAPLLLIRVRSRHWPGLGLKDHLAVVFLLALVITFGVLTAGEPFDANGDAGVYTLSALHLSETGRWTWALDEVVPVDVSEELVVYEPPYVRPWREVAPGFVVRGQRVVPQFFPLFPMWGAVFGDWLGIRGVLAANLLGALMMLLGCDALFRLLVGRIWRFAGLAAILLNPVFLVFLKYPSAEVFLAGILAGWLFWMVLFLRRPTARTAVLPAALLALAILVKFFAWAVAGAVIIVLVLLPRRHLGAAMVFPALLMPAAVLDLWLAAPHLENHLGQLMILSGFKLVGIGCGGILLLRVGWSKVARMAPVALGALYLAALVFLWTSAAASHLRDYATLSGRLVVWGAAAGLFWYVWRRRDTWLVFPAFAFALLSLYLFLGSGDSPYYPFAARRYLPVTVPLGALFLAYFARGSARTLRRLLPAARLAAAPIAVLFLAVALLPALWIQRSAVIVRQGAGFLDTLDVLDHVIPPGKMVLATGQAWRYSPYLLLGGKTVFSLDLRSPDALTRIGELVERHPGTLVLTDERRENGVVKTVEETRPSIRITNAPPLSAAPPRGSTFRLFTVERRDKAAPGRIDIGTDDQLLVAGCYAPAQADGRSFRWTGPRARILAGPGSQARFVWKAGGNPQIPLPVSVFVRGIHVGDARLEKDWQTSRWFDFPAGEGPTLIEIRTPTFQPALLGRGHDRRHLGLCIDSVETR